MDKLVVEHSIWISASCEKVWHMITESEQLSQWYAPGCKWEIPALQIGGTIKFYNTETDIQLAKIESVDVPHQFRVRWLIDSSDPEKGLVNIFHLAQEAEGTLVTISQTGYEFLPIDQRQVLMNADAEAYATVAENLKKYVETKLSPID